MVTVVEVRGCAREARYVNSALRSCDAGSRLLQEVRVLGSAKLVAFMPSLDLGKARPFYEEQLGLRLVSEDSFALVFDANGTTVRVAKVSELRPAQYTILGWEVSNVDYVVQELQKKGISLEKYNLPQQDGRGIWTAPSGAKVAWFKDPDGNVLSVSQLK